MNAIQPSPIYQQLRDIVMRLTPSSGRFATSIDGLMVTRREVQDELGNFFYNPMVGITLQGTKCSMIANETYHYGEGNCIIASVDIPSTNYLMQASPEVPFLAISLDLDRALCAEIANNMSSSQQNKVFSQSVAVSEVQPKMLEAFLRLMNLLDEPEDIPIMAPLLIREIHYRLLSGPQGEWLRTVCTIGSRNNQIAEAITWLRQHYKQTLNVDELAQRVNMATSTFYRHFNELTGSSPLQFQKQLRLYEAQRLMLVEKQDVNNAAYEVGYESSTQFIREYKREFGMPPRKDILRLSQHFHH